MSPIIPGQPLLQNMMRAWLVDTVTIEAPVGPGWGVVATDVPARIVENESRLSADGLLRIQETPLYVPRGTVIAAGYRVTRASDGQRWVTEIPRVRAEAPTIEVPLKGVR